jgi:hypothetical protein
MRLSTSEAKEDSKEAKILSPSAQTSLVIYNQIVININFRQKGARLSNKVFRRCTGINPFDTLLILMKTSLVFRAQILESLGCRISQYHNTFLCTRTLGRCISWLE